MLDKDTPMAIDGETSPTTIRAMIGGKWVVLGTGQLEHRDDGTYVVFEDETKGIVELFAVKNIPEISPGVYQLKKNETQEGEN